MPDSLDTPQARREQLAGLIQAHCQRTGFNDTAVNGLRLIYANCHRPREPICYEPGLVFIAQGHKTGYFDDRVIEYGPGQYLVQAMPVPFECETHVDPAEPLLGAAVRIDADMLAELVAEMPEPDDTASTQGLPMAAVSVTPAIEHALARLLDCLADPAAARVLAASRRREVIFEALRGPQGHLLRQLMSEQGAYARIGRAITRLRADYAAPLSVADLAAIAHMSVSSFHAHFKRVTQLSPVQYQKRMRLLRARELLVARTGSVGHVAQTVGYQSASQFSREYKRYFGTAPAHEAETASA